MSGQLHAAVDLPQGNSWLGAANRCGCFGAEEIGCPLQTIRPEVIVPTVQISFCVKNNVVFTVEKATKGQRECKGVSLLFL